MASAKEAPEDKVHDRAPSRVIIAEVSPEVDSGQPPIKRTAKDELGVAAGILGEEEQVTEPPGEAPEDEVHDRAPSRAITAEVSPEVDSGQPPIKRTAKDELGVAAGIPGEEEQVTESAREAPEDEVHDRAPSRAITAEVSPEVDSGQPPIKRTAKDELRVAAGIPGEEEQVTESAGEAPAEKVHDRAPSRVIIAAASPEVDGGQFPDQADDGGGGGGGCRHRWRRA